jgi:hypothetical protein
VKPSNVAVLRLLREAGSRGVTDLDILAEAHQRRASARIHDLRWMHHFDITSTLEWTPRGQRIARYRLMETAQTELGL